MTIAVLPFNAGPNTKPAYGRQFSNFAFEIVRPHTTEQLNAVNYLVELEGETPRYAYVNAAETINEGELIEQLFSQSGSERAMDGFVVEHEDGQISITARTFKDGSTTPVDVVEETFSKDQLFGALRKVVNLLANLVGASLPADLNDDENLFGTTKPDCLLHFFEGYDAMQYIEKTQGQVAMEFSPGPAIDSLLAAIEGDPDWEGPYITMVQLCRACTNNLIGDANFVEAGLQRLIALIPTDGRAIFALGEFYMAVGQAEKAAEQFEKASALEPTEPAILTRLGMAQMQMGMPVNAERNFRKAVEMEGDDKPSMHFLAQVLEAGGRAHEVPALWKELIAKNPQNAAAHARYGVSLIEAGNLDEGTRALDVALETLEDPTVVKRVYAPILAQKENASATELDRALDYYEDCLDASPTDPQLLLEYAQTLQAAGRHFEVPKVLNDVLATNPEQNLRAQTMAWLIELEQPKRVQTVQSANEKIQREEFAAAAAELRPMKNWLADYWKMWLLLANSLNQIGEHAEAEDAAGRLINLFPGCEPGYGELVNALAAQGKNEEAYNLMRFATTKVPNSLPVAINLALAAKRVGKEDEARGIAKQLREVVGANPDIIPVLEELER